MDPTSLGSILGGLLRKQTVTHLDVSKNPLGKNAIQHLADFLRADKRLQVLTAKDISLPRRGDDELIEFSKALETNITLARLDLRGNGLHSSITERLRRTMEEKRSIVPLPAESKYCFLLCNRHLPFCRQLPEVSCCEVSALFSDGACSPIVRIFQYCAQRRELLLDDTEDRAVDYTEVFGYLDMPGQHGSWPANQRGRPFWGEEMESDNDSAISDSSGSE